VLILLFMKIGYNRKDRVDSKTGLNGICAVHKSGTPRLKGRGLAEMGWHLPVFFASPPDQTQPGGSNSLSGYDIGKVKERTKRCVASLLLYNSQVNQVYKGEASA
jgi:hypothetical protein